MRRERRVVCTRQASGKRDDDSSDRHPAGHDRQGTLPRLLHLRARVPGQGHPHRRRAGGGAGRAVHRLRQLRPRLQPAGQAGAVLHRRRRGAARRRGQRRRVPGAELPGRVLGLRLAPPRRACSASSGSTSSRRSRSARTWWPRSTASCWPSPTASDTSPRAARRIVAYVERYHPELVDNLAPIVSPMIAQARVLRKLHGAGAEDRLHRPVHRQERRGRQRNGRRRGRRGPHVPGTSRDVRCGRRSRRSSSSPATSTRPRPGTGALFPISRGLLQAANITEDLRRRRGGGGRRADQLRRGDQGVRDRRRSTRGCWRCSAATGASSGPGMTSTERRCSAGAAASAGTSASDWPAATRPSGAEMRRAWRALDLSRGYTRERPADPGPVRGRDSPHPRADGQVRPRRRAELRRVRVRHLPRARRRDLQGPGRERDVPALHHRPASPHDSRAGGVATSSWPARRRP